MVTFTRELEETLGLTNLAVSENPLTFEQIGISALLPNIQNSTQPRALMGLKADKTSLSLVDPKPQVVTNGFDVVTADYSYSLKMPEDGVITNVLEVNQNVIELMYQTPNGKNDLLVVRKFYNSFEDFGYTLDFSERMENIRVGDFIKKDEVLASPRHTRGGIYSNTANLVCMAGTFLNTVEDSGWLSESGAYKLRGEIFYDVVVNRGPNDILINAYGKDGAYKPFPVVGDKIRQDLLIMAKRVIDDPLLAPSLLNEESLRDFNLEFDEPGFGKTINSEVVDFTIEHNRAVKLDSLDNFTRVLIKDSYHKHETYLTWYKENPNADMGSRLSLRLIKAFKNTRINKLMYKVIPVSTRITFTFRAELIPTVKSKVCGKYGNKTIIGKVYPDHLAPRLPDGTIVDYGHSADAVGNRNNSPVITIGGVGECCRQVRNKVRMWFGQDIHTGVTDTSILMNNVRTIEEAFDYVLGFLKVIESPLVPAYSTMDLTEKSEVLWEILSEDFIVIIPGTKISQMRYVNALKNSPYRLLKHKVSANMELGEFEFEDELSMTYTPIFFLNKIGITTMATTTPFENHSRLPTRLTQASRNRRQSNFKTVKMFDPTGTRTFEGYTEQSAFMDLIEQGKNPEVRNWTYGTLLRAPQPTNVEEVVDRNIIPYNQDPFNKLLKSIGFTMGYSYVYKSDGWTENMKFLSETVLRKMKFEVRL